MGENIKIGSDAAPLCASGIRGEVKLVMHLMPDGDRGCSDRIHVGRPRLVSAKGPLAVVVQCERHAGDTPTAWPRTDALNSDCFKFRSGLLRSLHSGLLTSARSKGLGYAGQAVAA